jgi:Rnl2 family RNA ligase
MEPASESEYKGYPEIENHYNEMVKKYIEEHTTTEPWVATEKIHGTNFSFIYDGKKVSHAKRNVPLDPKESFFNYQQTISKRHDAKIPKIFEKLKEKIPNLTQVTVFGEFYGGTYVGVQTKNKAIQKGLYYTPELEFEAFDIFFETDDGKKHILNYKEALKLFVEADLPYAEIVAEETLQQLMKTLDPEKYESQIYLKHKLEKVPDNFAEGFVLKPVDAIFVEGERFCIKFKNSRSLEVLAQKAAEKDTAAKPAPAAKKEVSSEDQEVIAKVMTYVNAARLQNIGSKLTEEERNLGKVVGLMMADVFKDFGKAEGKPLADKANKLKGQIAPLIKEETTKLYAAEYPEAAGK